MKDVSCSWMGWTQQSWVLLNWWFQSNCRENISELFYMVGQVAGKVHIEKHAGKLRKHWKRKGEGHYSYWTLKRGIKMLELKIACAGQWNRRGSPEFDQIHMKMY